jgi:hypothetical protein
MIQVGFLWHGGVMGMLLLVAFGIGDQPSWIRVVCGIYAIGGFSQFIRAISSATAIPNPPPTGQPNKKEKES